MTEKLNPKAYQGRVKPQFHYVPMNLLPGIADCLKDSDAYDRSNADLINESLLLIIDWFQNSNNGQSIDNNNLNKVVRNCILVATGHRDFRLVENNTCKYMPNFHLIPRNGLRLVSEVFKHGSEKYGVFNWRIDAIHLSDYFNAMMRHALAINAGEFRDPDSGIEHAAHIAAGAMIIMDAAIHGKAIDDRPGAKTQAYQKPNLAESLGECYQVIA